MTIFKKKMENKSAEDTTSSKASDSINDQAEVQQTEAIISEAEKNLQACQQELAQLKDRLIRSSADFENYRRRQERERLVWTDTVQKAVLEDLLTIVDDVDRAAAQLQQQERVPELEAWLAGIDLINKSLAKVLAKYGVQEMQDYSSFNPELHEAIAHIEVPGHKSGDIVEVLQKGYSYKDQVLRHAKVSVAK